MRRTRLTTSEIFGRDLEYTRAPNDLFAKIGRQVQHECFWGASEDGLNLPVALRPASDDAESFFAEAATYFSEFVPVTAYMRVLDERALLNSPRKLEEISPDLGLHEIRSAIGMAIGELLTASLRSAKTVSENVSYGASRRTLSFAVYRSSALHRLMPADQVVERWLRIREIVGMDSPVEQAASIAWIRSQQVLGASSRFQNELKNSIADTVCGRQSLSWLGDRLAASLGNVPYLIESMRGPFDDRSAAFGELVQAVETRMPNEELGGICIAYFCNEILPGSLSHFRLLAPLLPAYPTVVLWYGLFASLSDRFEWRETFSGLGLKMARDLLEPYSPWRRPTCDIAFAELEVLSRLPLKMEVVKPAHPRACLVEMFPGVEVFFRLGSDDDSRVQSGGDRQQPTEDQVMRDQMLRGLLREALDLVPDWSEPSTSLKRVKRLRR